MKHQHALNCKELYGWSIRPFIWLGVLPRKSLAEIFYGETAMDPEIGSWLVLYTFKGIRPQSKLYSNLARLIALARGDMEMRGVFKTDSKRGALTAIKIVKHYGGEASLFKVEEVTET